MVKIIGIFMVVVLFTGMPALAACSGGGSQSMQIGSPAPEFSLNDLNGQSVSLRDLRGKVVFINFWATTCPPCVMEMPHFQELYQDWSDREDVVILTINQGEDSRLVRNFMLRYNYSFPVLLDSQLTVSEKYRVQYIPTSILIDKEGRLQYRVVGPFKDKAAIVKAIEGVLNR